MFSKKTQNLTNTPNTGNAQNAIGIINNLMKLKSLPKIDRPREKLIQKGSQNLKDKNKKSR